MAPAQLELFKFSLYVFFPIAAMLHFGDPDWYDEHVGPLRAWFSQEKSIQVKAPQTPSELRSELARLREERLSKRAGRLGAPPVTTTTATGTEGTGKVAEALAQSGGTTTGEGGDRKV